MSVVEGNDASCQRVWYHGDQGGCVGRSPVVVWQLSSLLLTTLMLAKYCSIVRVMCFWCEEGLGMDDFRVECLVMTGSVSAVVLLSLDDGLGMAVFEQTAHVLWAGMRDGLGICDFFLNTFCTGVFRHL